jgi:hypothetical protein
MEESKQIIVTKNSQGTIDLLDFDDPNDDLNEKKPYENNNIN